MNRQIPQCHWQNGLTPWYYWHRGVWLHGIIDTAKSDFVVLLTPWSLTLWYYWHRRVWLHCIIDAAVSDSVVSLTQRRHSVVSLTSRSLTSRYYWHCRVKASWPCYFIHVTLHTVYLHKNISPQQRYFEWGLNVFAQLELTMAIVCGGRRGRGYLQLKQGTVSASKAGK